VAPKAKPEPESEPESEPGAGAPPLAELLDVGAFIRSQRERAEMSIRKLAELADVSNPYLSQIERGLRKPSADILQQVANALRISVETLYVRAGILPDHDRRIGTVPEAIDGDPDLTPEQKVALLNVYESFVAHKR
jgi:transcriptional regulator with XRE-family HTH domain